MTIDYWAMTNDKFRSLSTPAVLLAMKMILSVFWLTTWYDLIASGLQIKSCNIQPYGSSILQAGLGKLPGRWPLILLTAMSAPRRSK